MRGRGGSVWSAGLLPRLLGLRGPFSVSAALVIAVVGCGHSADDIEGAVGLQRDRSVVVDGRERVFDVYVPSGHAAADDPAAVVLLLHGQRSSKDDLAGRGRTVSPAVRWQSVADANNLFLLIPQGVDGSNGHAGWNDCRADVAGNPDTDDVAFLTAALDALAESHPVDQAPVFAVGTSNGGHMAMRLAQEDPDRLAGVAVIAAGMPADSVCPSASAPISTLFMWGTADPLAPYDGGAMAGDRGRILSAEDSIRYWVERNATDTEPITTTFEDLDPGDDSSVRRFFYGNGADDTAVALYEVVGGGHTEPSMEARHRRLYLRLVGNQNNDIETADEVWAFFQEVRAG